MNLSSIVSVIADNRIDRDLAPSQILLPSFHLAGKSKHRLGPLMHFRQATNDQASVTGRRGIRSYLIREADENGRSEMEEHK